VTNVVTIHRDEEEHSHPTVIAGVKSGYGILEDAKGIIQELEMLGIKPAAIMRSLRDKTSILPTILQSERLFGYV